MKILNPILMTFSIVFLFNSYKIHGQFQSHQVNIIDNQLKQSPHNPNRRSYQSPTQCRPDTIDYTRYKASSLNIVNISQNNGLGQYYDAPQKLTLSGFTFYAFVSSNPPTSRTVDVYLNVYKAGNDSLPTGNPLRSDTITIDTTFGGLLSNFERHAKFTPIQIDYPYIIAIVADTSKLNVGVVTNNWTANDGDGEFLNVGFINSNWYRGNNMTIGSSTFDADIILLPQVEYLLGNEFIIDKQCFNTNDSIFYRNEYNSNIVGSRFYNFYSFFYLDQFCHTWNNGDNSTFYQSIDGGANYSSKNNYDVTMISTLYYWRGSGNCQDTTIKTIYPIPDAPSVTGGGNKCEGDSAIFSVINGSQFDYFWTVNPNDTTSVLSNESFEIQNLSNDTTLYARVKNNLCFSNAIAVSVNVYENPDNPIINNDSICAGSMANLSAFSNINAVIEWYLDSLSLNPFHLGESFQTPILTGDTTFYVQANNFGCKSDERIAVKAFVSQTFTPPNPTVSPDTFACLSANTLINMQASVNTNDTLRWFNQASGGSPIAVGNTYQFVPTQRGIFFFYVDAWNGACESLRIPIQVEIEDVPVITSLTIDTVCAGSTAQVSASIPFGQIEWYDKMSGGNLISNQSTLSFNNLQNDTTLFIETKSASCVSNSRQAVTIKTITLPTVLFSSGDTICSEGRALLKAQASDGNIHWYDNLSDTSFLGTGNTFLTGQLMTGKTFYAIADNQGCLSQKIPVTTLVNLRPNSDFFIDILTKQRVKFTPLTTNNVSADWNLGDGNSSSEIIYTHQYQDSGTYQVQLILTSLSNSCQDTTIKSVKVIWDPSSVIELIKSGENSWMVSPNPSQGKVSLITNFDIENTPLFIYDLKGSLIKKLTVSIHSGELLSINLPSESGIYIINFVGKSLKCIVE
jgi:hypothetical protein